MSNYFFQYRPTFFYSFLKCLLVNKFRLLAMLACGELISTPRNVSLRGVDFFQLKIRISPRKRNFKRNYFQGPRWGGLISRDIVTLSMGHEREHVDRSNLSKKIVLFFPFSGSASDTSASSSKKVPGPHQIKLHRF